MGYGASEAARFQAYQTRARMGAQLWARVLMWTLAGWVALTMYMVWRQTGEFYPQLRHAYFWRWVFCGIVTDIPFLNTIALRCSLPLDGGGWYPVGPRQTG